MSVIKFSVAEMRAIYEALTQYENRETYAWVIDRLRYKEIGGDETWDFWINTQITRFVIRLNIANDLAWMWSYHRDWKQAYTLDLLDLSADVEYQSLTKKELASKLSSLKYNCISQGGTVHLNKADEERLDHLITSLQRRVIGDYEKWEASLRES